MLSRLSSLAFSILLLSPFANTIAEVSNETDFHMRSEVKDMRMAMERLHYSQKNPSDISYEDLIVNYMERLDFNHLYFLQNDRLLWEQRFGRTLKKTYLDKNELYPAFYIFNTFEERVNERLEWVRSFLENDIDLFEEDSYEFNDEDETWPKTEDEADLVWKHRVKNEILNEIIPDIRKEIDTHFEEKEEHELLTMDLLNEIVTPEVLSEKVTKAKTKIVERYERWATRIADMKQAEVQEDFLTELAQLYDPHSNFMSPDTSEEFGINISNELIGIGAVLADENGYCKIQELVDSGPAKKSGELAKGDTIVGVAQGRGEFEDIVGKRLRDIVRLIRGKENSIVRLKVLPESGPDTEKIVSITRERIKLEEKLASAELYQIPVNDRTVPIGVIKLPNFYGPTGSSSLSSRASTDVDKLIQRLKSHNVQGIILDLRVNGGGLLEEAINVTGLFISSGPVVKVMDRSGDVEVSRDWNKSISWDGPLAVLTSRYSASASEIVAGALQYYKRALVVGDKSTHGKGTVQSTFTLPISVYDLYGESQFLRPNFLQRVGRLIPVQTNRNGIPSMAKITIAKYYLPDGSSTQLRGVLSDISLPSVAEFLPIRESDLENPLAWDNIGGDEAKLDEIVSNSYPYLQQDLIDLLAARSTERMQKLEEFDYLKKSITFSKERYDRDTVPLSLLSRINMLIEDDLVSEELEEINKGLGKYAYESMPIDLKPKSQQVEEPQVEETTVAENEESSEEESEDDKKRIDIHLRETMRIVSDWIELEKFIDSGEEQRHIAINTIGDALRSGELLSEFEDYSKTN
ncbi:MAG: carboxy terminal-processing peptidase [Opitutales bacterium]|nr:carboxy terminal-processing peptidase [Opitutales bacterium]